MATACAFAPAYAHAAPPLPAQINFQPGAPSPVPLGWTADTGTAWSEAAGYGWIRQDSLSSTHVPLDITPNTRDRNLETDQTLDTLVHMQYPGNGNTAAVMTPAAWEYAVPNGTYIVSVAVGDPAAGTDLENDVINIEGLAAIPGFVPTGPNGASTRHARATVTVSVTDGRLTIDALGGTNTKLDYVTIGLPDTTPPAAPANLAAAAGSGAVQLSWNANTESDLKGYNLYRSTTTPVSTSGSPINATPVTAPVYLDSSAANGTTYYYAITAVDTSGNASAASATVSATPQSALATVNLNVNFADQSTVPPPSYLTDFGQAFAPRTGTNQGTGLTYGWVVPGTHTPLSLVGNGRNRGTPSDVRLATFLHMQYTGTSGVTSPGAWEAAVVNGTYTVTVSVGDASFYDSTHRINVEGTNAISGYAPTSAAPFSSATVTVNVTDGRLTIDANGGLNTKIDYVAISNSGTAPPPPPPSSTTTVNWSTVAPTPIPLSEAGSAVVGGKLYVFGGYVDSTYVPTNKAEVYDPATNAWSSIAPMPVGLTHMGVATDGTNVYIAGGYPPNSTKTAQLFATTGVWKYDPTANSWTTLTSLPAARGGGALVNLNGVLHYFGGSDASRNDANTHWTMPIGGTAWSTAAPLPVGRNHLGGVVLNGKVWAVAGQMGQDAAAVYSAELDSYDPATDSWTRMADLPSARSHIASATFLLGGKITTVGGETAYGNSTSQVLQYDSATNTWSQMTPLPVPRNSGAAGNVNGTIFYSGGLLNTDTYKGVVPSGTSGSGAQEIAVNFQPQSATPPGGYLLDYGQAYGARTDPGQGTGLTYGWLSAGTNTPLSLVGNARQRTINSDKRYDTLIHMQYTGSSNGVASPGDWRVNLPNGTYEVIAAVGDPGAYYDSAHSLTINGVPFVQNFTPTAAARFQVATKPVSVTNGTLTASAAGGTNTKLDWLDIVPTSATQPYVTKTTPATGATGILLDAGVSAEVKLPNVGFGIDAATLTASTVKLIRMTDNSQVPALVNTTGGGDAIVLQPKTPLDPSTSYRFEVTSGVKDLSGAAFLPYVTTFTTGTASSSTATNGISFSQIALPTTTGKMYTALVFGPDGFLYASTFDGLIYKFPVNADGSLGTPTVINSIQAAAGGAQRIIVGMAFDPASTAANPILWVTNNDPDTSNAADWTGKITRLSGAGLTTVQDYVVGLPRSIRDHMTNSLHFGPDGALYVTQGSNSSSGAPDSAWGNRGEDLLSAALLRVDTKAITSPPLDAKTPDGGGTYNPYAAGAPLTIYADGMRNSYDFVFASNGQLYVPVNGASAGGNTPATPGTLPASCSSRIDSASNGAYTGPSVPGVTNLTTAADDYLVRVVKGGYYGHPNPARCEWAANGGNPSMLTDPFELPDYPVGVQPDRNFRGYAWDFGPHYSPDGIIEYKSTVFGGALKGKLLVARYSGGKDIVALTPGTNGDIASTIIGIAGFTSLNNPLALVEDPSGNGNIYVSEFGAPDLLLLKPLVQSTNAHLKVTNLDGEPFSDRLVFNRIGTLASPPSNGVHDTDKLQLSNTGTDPLSISALTISGPWQLVSPPSLPASIAPGASLTLTVKFVAESLPGTGRVWNGSLAIQSNDAASTTTTVQLSGYWQNVSEGGVEPTLAEVVQVFGYKTAITFDGQQLAQAGLIRATGDETLSPYWVRADSTKAVTVRQVDAFHSCFQTADFYWFARGSTTNNLALITDGTDCQSLLPRINGLSGPAQTSFSPTTAFGFKVSLGESSDPTQVNTGPDVTAGCPGPCGHHVRFWQIKDRSGAIVPNTYLMAMDFSGINYDYNDNVYLIRNIKPAPPSQVLYRLDTGGSANYTDTQGNIWTPDTGYFSPSTTSAEGANYAIQAINWTDDDPLFDTYRAFIPNTTQAQRVLTYTLPIAAGVSQVNVKLFYAERYWTATGQRVFNVDINGTRVSTNFDIFKVAPGANNAFMVPVYHVPVTSGTLTITFTASVDFGAVNAIEVDADP